MTTNYGVPPGILTPQNMLPDPMELKRILAGLHPQYLQAGPPEPGYGVPSGVLTPQNMMPPMPNIPTPDPGNQFAGPYPLNEPSRYGDVTGPLAPPPSDPAGPYPLQAGPPVAGNPAEFQANPAEFQQILQALSDPTQMGPPPVAPQGPSAPSNMDPQIPPQPTQYDPASVSSAMPSFMPSDETRDKIRHAESSILRAGPGDVLSGLGQAAGYVGGKIKDVATIPIPDPAEMLANYLSPPMAGAEGGASSGSPVGGPGEQAGSPYGGPPMDIPGAREPRKGQPPADMAPEGGGGPQQPSTGGSGQVTTGGGMTAPLPPTLEVPKPEEVPQADYSDVYRMLNEARPDRPEEMSTKEKLVNILAGLASGAAQGYASSGGRDIGSVVIGAGQGGAAAGLGITEQAKREHDKYRQDTAEHTMKIAEVRAKEILDAHGIDAQNIQQRNQYRTNLATAAYDRAKAGQSKIVVTPYGTQIVTQDPVTGKLTTQFEPGPMEQQRALDQKARLREILVKAMIAGPGGVGSGVGGKGGKMDYKVHFPYAGDVDLATLGPSGMLALSAKGWAESPSAQMERDKMALEMQNDPDKYPEMQQMAMGKPDDFRKAVTMRVAEKRTMDMINAHNAGDEATKDKLYHEGLEWVNDAQDIIAIRGNRQGNQMQEEDLQNIYQQETGDPGANFLQGLQ